MPVIIALEKLHKIPVKPWTGPILTQGNLPLLKSRLLVQVTPPQPLYRCLMESRPSYVSAFRKKVCTSAALWRAFDKAVRRKPPVVAADAGRMQIQLREGAVSRCAEAVQQSTTDDTGR